MTRLGIKAAFNRYNAKLRNVQWSVSAWTNDDKYLVVSLWSHHRTKSPCEGTVEFSDSVNRWGGPGNAEFRNNLAKAFSEKKPILLVEVLTEDPDHIEAGRDASQVKKEFYLRRELIGEVIEYNETTGRYVIRFARL